MRCSCGSPSQTITPSTWTQFGVPSKYPGKTYFKGRKHGKPSGNPLGKNPSDFWGFLSEEWEREVWEIPNVKANHPEKSIHPCQFPIELVERCVLAFTDEDSMGS